MTDSYRRKNSFLHRPRSDRVSGTSSQGLWQRLNPSDLRSSGKKFNIEVTHLCHAKPIEGLHGDRLKPSVKPKWCFLYICIQVNYFHKIIVFRRVIIIFGCCDHSGKRLALYLHCFQALNKGHVCHGDIVNKLQTWFLIANCRVTWTGIGTTILEVPERDPATGPPFEAIPWRPPDPLPDVPQPDPEPWTIPALTRFHLARRFWNQILTWTSVSRRLCAI